MIKDGEDLHGLETTDLKNLGSFARCANRKISEISPLSFKERNNLKF